MSISNGAQRASRRIHPRHGSRRTLFVLLVAISSVIGVIGAFPPAQVLAADVIVNGGFEAGSFTGWTASGTVAS